MNILLMDGLPEEYEGVPISADFRNMIQVDLLLHDPGLSDIERTIAALTQLYPDIPKDIGMAIQGLEWFFMRGERRDEGEAIGVKTKRKAFDFEQDANLIYAAFYSTYGLSLTTVDFLHWWEFMALFEGLPESTLMQRVIYWRTVDLAGLDKHEKKRVKQMRKIFALKEPEREALSVEEIDQRTLDRVARRFEEAEKMLNNN